MKKKILGGIAVLAFAAIAGLNIQMNTNENQVSDLALANVEALASGENNTVNTKYEKSVSTSWETTEVINDTKMKCTHDQGDCIGSGSHDCVHYYFKNCFKAMN